MVKLQEKIGNSNITFPKVECETEMTKNTAAGGDNISTHLYLYAAIIDFTEYILQKIDKIRNGYFCTIYGFKIAFHIQPRNSDYKMDLIGIGDTALKLLKNYFDNKIQYFGRVQGKIIKTLLIKGVFVGDYVFKDFFKKSYQYFVQELFIIYYYLLI